MRSCLRKLDEWAELVRQETDRLAPQFRRQPEDYENSWAYFRMLALMTTLQRMCGVRYNPDKTAPDVPFTTDDTFIHGIINGNGGTCASLPVVYAAVGRRLAYPLKLVAARATEAKCGHFFLRWDEPPADRFNIEPTAEGLACPPDEYYRTGPYEISPGLQQVACLLASMTPAEEL